MGKNFDKIIDLEEKFLNLTLNARLLKKSNKNQTDINEIELEKEIKKIKFVFYI